MILHIMWLGIITYVVGILLILGYPIVLRVTRGQDLTLNEEVLENPDRQ